MARLLLYAAMGLSIFAPASVFAALNLTEPTTLEIIYRSSGVELLDRLETAMGQEPWNKEETFPSMVPASPSEASLAREFDEFLLDAFQILAGNPDESTVKFIVDQLFFIFVTHAGSDVVTDAEKEKLFLDVIRSFVKPVHERSPGSCVVLLDPRTSKTVH